MKKQEVLTEKELVNEIENKEVENALVAQPQEFKFVDETGKDFVAELLDKKVSFCSLEATDTKSKVVLFNAMNNPTKRLGDCINEVLEITDVYAETVTMKDKLTGEITVAPRIVLIDKEGLSYQAVSMGIFNGVKKLFTAFGAPSWANDPIKLKVKQITKDTNKILVIEAV